jgi:hypothetical protein
MATGIDCRQWQISTGRHFQNGRHNTAKIQHCLISSKFDMWVDNDVPNWLPTMYPHMKWRWNRTMLNLCGIVVAILKMATDRNFSMSGHHYLPTYQNDISYVGRLWCPELIPDIEIISIIVSKVFMSKACMVVSGISCHCIWTNTDYYNNKKRCLPASSKFLEIGLRN